MKLLRFLHEGRFSCGILNDDTMVQSIEGNFFAPSRPMETFHEISQIQLLPPCIPSKVVAVGLNYRDHAKELNFPVPDTPIVFLKPPTAVIGPGEAVLYPSASSQVDYEAELGIVMKDRARKISPADARDHILGYTCANDVTARDLQKRDVQWTRAKSFDTFCPVGPWIETELNPDDLLVELYLNGERRQSSRTSQFIFTVDYLVSFISGIMTLEPGDLIITGTPAGVGPMMPGDEIEVRIQGIGSLKNTVKR
jgi:2-keto-4-pentenoate hydratase/2-oxohepta-3-ene-1,7-dioic acid hydratase in catechol pathway